MFAYTGGLQGITGDAGAQGDAGAKGDQGDQGIQGEQGAAGSAFDSRFSVYRSAVQSIPYNDWTQVEFNAEYYDNNAEYEHESNFVWTCKNEGDYHFGGIVKIASLVDTETILLNIVSSVNGVVIPGGLKVGDAGAAHVVANGDYHCVVDETIHVEAFHNKTGSKNSGSLRDVVFFGHRFG